MRFIHAVATAALLFIALSAGYLLLRSQLHARIYRERLDTLSREYEQLRTDYNDAVRKSAVTELQVRDGRLSVVVMSAAGQLERIETPYDPAAEIHVDFVVRGGRLLIRRVHDEHTAPSQALVIDPQLSDVPWDDAGATYGISVYRPLSEGRWVVSATQNGALTLRRAADDAPVSLVQRPPVRDFATLDAAVGEQLDAITPADVLGALAR